MIRSCLRHFCIQLNVLPLSHRLSGDEAELLVRLRRTQGHVVHGVPVTQAEMEDDSEISNSSLEKDKKRKQQRRRTLSWGLAALVVVLIVVVVLVLVFRPTNDDISDL